MLPNDPYSRYVGQPVEDGEVEVFVRRELGRGVKPREETPYIWADFFGVPVQQVLDIIKKVQGEGGNDA